MAKKKEPEGDGKDKAKPGKRDKPEKKKGVVPPAEGRRFIKGGAAANLPPKRGAGRAADPPQGLSTWGRPTVNAPVTQPASHRNPLKGLRKNKKRN